MLPTTNMELFCIVLETFIGLARGREVVAAGMNGEVTSESIVLLLRQPFSGMMSLRYRPKGESSH